MCDGKPELPAEERNRYYLLVSLFDHVYWIAGSAAGAVVGTLIKFDSEGIDFALTALFVTVFLEQWLSTKKHLPALIGVVVSVLCLVVFGSESFLIPAMLLITLLLCLYREEKQ